MSDQEPVAPGYPMSEGVLELIRTRAVCLRRGDKNFPGAHLGKAIERDRERTGIDALAVMERVLKERPGMADGYFDAGMSNPEYMELRGWVRGLCEEMRVTG